MTTSELGRRLGVSKQGAAKTAAGLENVGYIAREPDPEDARAVLLKPTPRGIEMLALSAEIFDRLRAEWATELGPERLAALGRRPAERRRPVRDQARRPARVVAMSARGVDTLSPG